MQKSTTQDLAWHKENCPCKGKPQEKSKRLEARQRDISSSGQTALGNGKTCFFFKPGSQNRKK